MSVGDIYRPKPPPVAKADRYPESRATGEAVAGSINSSYSYAQNVGTHVIQWTAPIRLNRRFEVIDMPSSDPEAIVQGWFDRPPHWTHLRAVVWWGIGEGSPQSQSPMQTRLVISEFNPPSPPAQEFEQIALTDFVVGEPDIPPQPPPLPPGGLFRSDVRLDIRAAPVETYNLQVDLQRLVRTLIIFHSVTVWAEVDP